MTAKMRATDKAPWRPAMLTAVAGLWLIGYLSGPAVAQAGSAPGVRETLRVNGSARISVDPELLDRFLVDGKAPRSVTVIQVEEVFFHCARALIRSRLWNPDQYVDRSELPSMGTILAAHTNGLVEQCAYDAELPVRIVQSLY